jgi:hypothetical protein
VRELTYVKPGRPRKPKGPTARYRAKRRRAEGPVKKAVRAECVERDGWCVIKRSGFPTDVFAPDVDVTCAGQSEWAHMHSRRRSQTRNQAPGVRHDTKHSFMACKRHHDQYDGRQSPRLFVTALTDKGADGPLKFRRGK